ncbi:MAG: hypothetical protein K1X95_06605 [Acidimicrobiia bacterium]|nr:hypothetical protein [Acidimicrobiia bacterium]
MRSDWPPAERQRARYRAVWAAMRRRPAPERFIGVTITNSLAILSDSPIPDDVAAWTWRKHELRVCRRVIESAAPPPDSTPILDPAVDLDPTANSSDRSESPPPPDPATQPARSLVAAPSAPPLAA